MFVHYRTRGIIIDQKDRGEFDQLFTIFTREFGKLEIIGKAIRKASSKLRQGAAPFYLTEIEFIQGKSQKTLTDAVLIEKFVSIRKDLEKLKWAFQIGETLDGLVRGQEPDEKIWQLLLKTLERLDGLSLSGDSERVEILYRYFFWNLLTILGYRPELYYCSVCRKKLAPANNYFDFKEGGAVCPDCAGKKADELSPETIKILRVILGAKPETLFRLRGIEERCFKELKSISEKYYLSLCENLSSF
ncbi:MAG: DNA repair protein RecO [Candidatus Nealsonbacteria bacterium]|nr:DNA repair protein RecO [Candidatus Nealsonbacteria bacterium]